MDDNQGHLRWYNGELLVDSKGSVGKYNVIDDAAYCGIFTDQILKMTS